MQQTIVCIDDEGHNNEALERLLRKKYKVYTALTPADGLELIKIHQPALIISDQRMPQMTGVELLKQSVALSPNSVRILLTGYTDLESVIAAINEGEIYRYITKPWDPNDLSLTVDKAVESHDLKLEIKKQNIELQSLDRLKTEFMILVTHELRTPVAGIASFVELLKEEIKDKDHQTYLKHIEKNSDRLKKLIQDILIITKLKQDNAKTNIEDVNPHEIFKVLWLENSGKKIKLSSSGEPWSFKGDASQVKEIFTRLIENCKLYAAAQSQVVYQSDQTKNIIKISNEAPKVITANADHLLNAFTKNEAIMNHTQGTGLGLAVVKALMESLGGSLTLEIKDKTFTVILKFPKN